VTDNRQSFLLPATPARPSFALVSGEWCDALFAIRISFPEHDLRQMAPAVAPAFITIRPGNVAL